MKPIGTVLHEGSIKQYVNKDENGYELADGQWVSERACEEMDMFDPFGVGKDAETVVNEKGGKQSKLLYRFDLLEPKAMFEMTKVLSEGAEKYGADNWKLISVREHINHLLVHAYAYLAGDQSDEHLSHMMCRSMFAQSVALQEGEGK